MPHPAHELLPISILNNISPTAGTFVIIVLFLFFQILFKFDFVCPCAPNYFWHVFFCILYMVLPAFIFFFISILMDKKRVKVCGCTRGKPSESDRFDWKEFCPVFLRASCMGLLWVVIALIDGDWFVCLMTHSNGTAEEQLACKQV